MKYLLDINVLIALGIDTHPHRQRAESWVRALDPRNDEIASCSIVDLGFVRIISQIPYYGFAVADARELLINLKLRSPVPFVFLNDHSGIETLPAWVKQPKQITDGHLLQLAKSHRARLATLDGKIPGAFVIP